MILFSYDDNSDESNSSFEVYPAAHKYLELEIPADEDSLPSNRDCSTKRVSFQESANEYYEETWRTAEDCAMQWYDYDDYRNFKQNDNDLIEQVKASLKRPTSRRNLQATFTYTLRKLYTTIRAASYSSVETLEQALSTPGQQRQMQSLYSTEKEDDRLDAEYPCSFSRLDLIGLEFKLVTILKGDNRLFRQQIRQQVLGAQAECRDGLWPEEEWITVVEEASRSISAPLTLFAQLLAQAQFCGN